MTEPQTDENLTPLFKTASRWPGKAAISIDTGENLAAHLEELHGYIEAAETDYQNGDLGRAYAQMTNAEALVSHIEQKTGWSDTGYEYKEKFQNESVPAIHALLRKLNEAA